jgi:hypothetical protein
VVFKVDHVFEAGKSTSHVSVVHGKWSKARTAVDAMTRSSTLAIASFAWANLCWASLSVLMYLGCPWPQSKTPNNLGREIDEVLNWVEAPAVVVKVG